MPGGHPTDYKPEYCDLVIEHMKKGKSVRSFAALCDVCFKTVYNWMDKFPEFLSAVERGKQYAYAWWEEQGINGLYDSSIVETASDGTVTKSFTKINVRVFELFMHNMFDWSKKETVEQKTELKVDTDSIAVLSEKITQAAMLAAKK